MRRRLLLVPFLLTGLMLAAGPASSDEGTYSPLDRPGPALSVPPSLLHKALTCEGYRGVRRLRDPHDGAVKRTPDRRTRHSQGGMLPRWALRFWPDTRRLVDDMVGLAPSNHGTVVSQVICTPSCPVAHRRQAAGSHFLDALNSRAETFAGVDYTSVYTHYDEIVVPNQDQTGSSTLRTGSGKRTNVATQEVCPANTADHLSIGTYDPVAYALALDALDHPGPADVQRVRESGVCTSLLHPGVNPATFATDYGETLRLLVTAYAVAQSTTSEPALRGYVFATRRLRGRHDSRLGSGAVRRPGADLDPDHQRGPRGQPRRSRRHQQAPRHDRVGRS